MVICLELGADLHMAQLMLLPLTVSCLYSKTKSDDYLQQKKGKQQRLTNQLSILSFMSGRHYTNSSMANVGMMCILLSFLNIDISQCNRLVRVTYLSVMKDLFLFLHSV